MPGPATASSSAPSAAWPAVLLLALVVLVFGPVLNHPFVSWDDTHTIVTNPMVTEPSLAALRQAWTGPHGDLYIPLTYTLWIALGAISAAFGLHDPGQPPAAWLFHAASLAFHALAALAVWLILRRILGRAWLAFFAASFWALHPAQAEAVAWASGLKDVLCGALSLLALYAFITTPDQPGLRRPARYAIATLLFTLALLAKPAAVVAPLLAIALDLHLRGPSRSLAFRAAPWFILAAGGAWLAQAAQPAAHVDPTPWLARPVIALDALAFYLAKILAPVGLCLDYGRSPRWLLASPHRFWTWLVPLAPAVALLIRPNRVFLLALALFALALLPVLGLVPFDFQSYSTVADHYLYVALLGPALAIGFALSRAPTRPALAVAAPILLLSGLRSIVQLNTWSNTSTLMRHTLAINPDSLAANVNLAKYILDRADADKADPQEAIPLLERAIRTSVNDPDAHALMGNALAMLRRYDEAFDQYRLALARRPRDSDLHFNYANALRDAARFPEAQKEYEESIRLRPSAMAPYINFAVMIHTRGETARAREIAARAVQAAPNDPRAAGLLRSLQAPTP